MSAGRGSFFAELQRRSVYKVGAMYAVAGWLLVQVVTQVFPIFDISALVQRIIVLVIVAGFPVALVLAWVFDLTPDGIVRTDDGVPQPATPAAARAQASLDRRLNIVLALLLAIALSYLAADRLGAFGADRPVDEGQKSIAVLPFENLSDDKANAYFAIGMQDEILTRLSKIGALRVVSRTSTTPYVSRPDNLPEIARQLGVAYVLEGSVQKDGDAVRVNVQLIRADTDEHLWAESYDRQLDSIFGVQGEVAGAIAHALDARLSGSERRALSQLPTRDAQAYDAYLRGVALQTAYGESRAYFDSLIALYTQAVKADPDFAQAWAQLSIARTQQYFYNDHTATQLAAAKAAVDAALRLQPELPEGWMALGFYRYWGEADYAASLDAYAHAETMMPNDPMLTEFIALAMRRQGRWDESLVQLQKGARLDPGNAEIWINIGFSQQFLRRYEPAREAYARGLKAQPGSDILLGSIAASYLDEGDLANAAATLARLQLDPAKTRVSSPYSQLWRMRRDYDTGIAQWDAALQAVPELPALDLAASLIERGSLKACAGRADAARADFLLARDRVNQLLREGQNGFLVLTLASATASLTGDHDNARRYVAELVDVTRDDAFNRSAARVSLASVQMLAGDVEAAIEPLRLSLQEPGGITQAELRQDCRWDAMRQDPRFAALLTPVR